MKRVSIYHQSSLDALVFQRGRHTTYNVLKKLVKPLLMVTCMMFIMLGCSSEENELRRYMHEVRTRPAKSIEPLPTFTPLPKFKYPEEAKRRSPFKPQDEEQEEKSTQAPNVNRPKQPLEAFPLDALQFVGTLKEGSTIWGLISQPGGKISRVRPGDYMGKNFGQVMRITDNSMIVEETIKVDGKWDKRRINLKLRATKAK